MLEHGSTNQSKYYPLDQLGYSESWDSQRGAKGKLGERNLYLQP